MRWNESTYDICDWNAWYAWRPVKVGTEWVWFELVERQLCMGYGDSWNYRFPTEGGPS